MLENMKQEVCDQMKMLKGNRLVTLSFGCVSAIDRERNLMVIKPTGMTIDDLRPNDMVVVDMDGNVVEGDHEPSSDMRTHLYIYKHFSAIGGIAHAHSAYAVSWAQACRSIPCYGSTHADYFMGDIPCTRVMTEREVEEDYEGNTGKVLVEAMGDIDPEYMPGALAAFHGPYTWGKDAAQAVFYSMIIEKIATLAYDTEHINPAARRLPQYLLDKHYSRKHGNDVYYDTEVERIMNSGNLW